MQTTLNCASLRGRKLMGGFLTVVTGLTTACAAMILLSILFQIVWHAGGNLSWHSLFELPPPPGEEGGGFGNAILGTLLMVALGLIMSFPVAFFAALYLAEFGRRSTIGTFVHEAVALLNTAPSIIVGLFAYAVVVAATGTFSALAGGFALAMIMLPMLVRATEEGLRGVPDSQRFAAQSVGCSRAQAVFLIVLPQAAPSIITGVILAVARAAGESAPLIFTALFSQYWATKIMAPAPSLSVLIYNFATSPYHNQQALAWSAAFVLVLMLMTVNLALRAVTNRIAKRFAS